MARFRDWQSRLQVLLAERRAREFEWGSQDCCLFVCDAVLAMTGRDPAADVRGYESQREALRIVQRLGGMRSIAGSRFGQEIHPTLAQVGDVGLVLVEGRESLALCGGAHWLAAGLYGLESLPTTAVTGAWRCE